MVEYESFEDVLGDLDLNEDELKRLVSEGSLRAYRDDDRMKFRKDDIEQLRRSNMTDLGSQPTVAGDDSGMGDGLEVVEETDETVLDVGDLSEDVDFEDTGSTSVPTVELDSGLDGDDATLTEELTFDSGDEFEDADATMAMDEGVTLDEDDLGLETEPLDGLDDGEATVVDDGGLDFDDDDLGLDDGGLDFEDQGAEQPMDDFGDGAADDYAPGPMVAPQVQVQERIKYVEILPSETWWTKLVGIVVILLLGYSLFAVFGVEDRDESAGSTATIGYNVFKSSRNVTLESQVEGMRPESVTKSETPSEELAKAYEKASNWVTSGAETGSDNYFYPGQAMIRRPNGQAPANPLEAGQQGASVLKDFNGGVDMTPEWMAEQEKSSDGQSKNLSELRRVNSRPTVDSSSAASE